MVMELILIPGLPNDLARECLWRLPFQSFPSLLTVSKAWNKEIKCADFHHSRSLSGLTRPVFILTGRDRVTHSLSIRLFDADRRRLGSSRLPQLQLESPAFSGLVSAGSSSVIVISCGWQRLGNGSGLRLMHVVHVFDLLTGKWRRAADMPSDPDMWYGVGICADPVNRKVVVAGGYGGQSRALRSTIMYDVAEDKWMCLDDMANARQSASVVFHYGRFHVVSGYGEAFSYNHLTCAESLDPKTLRWGPIDEGFLEQGEEDGSPACVVNEDGDLYSVGKSVGVRRGDTWEEVARVPREAWCKKGVVTWKGKMLVLSHSGKEPSYNYLLDLNTYEWSKFDGDSDSTVIEFGCGMDL